MATIASSIVVVSSPMFSIQIITIQMYYMITYELCNCLIPKALATKGWMMYYASALTLLGGLGHTPLRSLMSKMVEPDEYGKIFTFTSVTGA